MQNTSDTGRETDMADRFDEYADVVTPGAVAGTPGHPTPGPWVIGAKQDAPEERLDIQEGRVGYTVASAWGGGDMDRAMHANARAIREVPAMLHLLPHIAALMEGATPDANDRTDWHETLTTLRALLARVEGRS